MKSILHNKENHTCFLCMLLKQDDSRKEVLHEHHVVYGKGKRLLSEKYGLKVYLCLEHHLTGPEAVHRNREIALILIQAAEVIFIKQYSMEKWMEVFGKNYLPDGYVIQDNTKTENHDTGHQGFQPQWIDEQN